MARQESDREDLIRDAVAYADRIEWLVPGEAMPVFAGLRNDGCFAVYFGPDPVYHFDSEGRLRRAFVDGLLYRTQGSTLASLDRQRMADETVLERSDLKADDLASFLDSMAERLAALIKSLNEKTARETRAVLGNRSANDVLSALCQTVNPSPRLAPAIPTRRT